MLPSVWYVGREVLAIDSECLGMLAKCMISNYVPPMDSHDVADGVHIPITCDVASLLPVAKWELWEAHFSVKAT
jgi:hypothetical protein